MAKKNKKGGQISRAQQQADATRRRGGGAIPGRGGSAESRVPAQLSPAQSGAVTSASSPARATEPAPATEPARVAASAAVKPEGQQYYLDVSAVRIQEWLGRTPDLLFRRGASNLLSEQTERELREAKLPPGARWNDEAGEVDGVVPLILDDPAAATSVARQVVGELRQAMPYCPLIAVTGTAARYVEAYPGMERSRRSRTVLIDSPAPPQEAFVAKPCDQCRSAAATRPSVRETDEGKVLCADCAARLGAAGRTAAERRDRAPRAEKELRKALTGKGAGLPARTGLLEGAVLPGGAGFPEDARLPDGAGFPVRTGLLEGAVFPDDIDFPADMKELAAAGRISGDDRPTQVALIYADGNSVGAFLSEAVKAGIAKEDIAPALEAATIGALAEAVRQRFTGWTRLPVMAYLVGGDDLLIEVPAIDAWQFTRVLLAEFGRQIAEKAQQRWRGLTPGKLPSLSAGMVFRHYKAPFSDAVRLADEQLHAAKQATRGAAASVAFLDITADGGSVPGRREPLRLDYLTANADVLDGTARLAGSRRAMLLDLLRRRDAAMSQQEVAALAGDETEAQQAKEARGKAEDQFVKQLINLRNEPLWTLVTGTPKPDGVKAELEKNPGRWDELRLVLDIARYWHTETRTDLGDPDLSDSDAGRQA